MSDQNKQKPNDIIEQSIDSSQEAIETSLDKTKHNTDTNQKRRIKSNENTANMPTHKSKSNTVPIVIALVAFISAVGSVIYNKQEISALTNKANEIDQIKTTANDLKSTLETQLSTLQQQTKALQADTQNYASVEPKVQAQLKDFDSKLTRLLAAQQILGEQVSKVSVDSSRLWMYFEARQLLKQIPLRLRAADVTGAIALLEEIHNIIKEQGNLSLTASETSQKIESAILKLRQSRIVDRSAIYNQLAALQTEMAKLEPKQAIFNQNTPKEKKPETNLEKITDALSSYVKIDFNGSSQSLPILTSQGVGQLQMALDISIEKAQWAVLNAETGIYETELKRIKGLLDQYFDRSSQKVIAISDQINVLEKTSLTNDISNIDNELDIIGQHIKTQIEYNQQVLPRKGGK